MSNAQMTSLLIHLKGDEVAKLEHEMKCDRPLVNPFSQPADQELGLDTHHTSLAILFP